MEEKTTEDRLKMSLKTLHEEFQKVLTVCNFDKFPFLSEQLNNEQMFSPIKLKMSKIEEEINKTTYSMMKLDMQSKKSNSMKIVISIFVDLFEKIQENLKIEIERIQKKVEETENENKINRERINVLKQEIVEIKSMSDESTLNLKNLNDLMIDTANEYVSLQKKWIIINEEKENIFPYLGNLKKEYISLKQTHNLLNSRSNDLQNEQSKLNNETTLFSVNMNKQQKINENKKCTIRAKHLDLSTDETSINKNQIKIDMYKNQIEEVKANLEKKKEVINELKQLISNTEEESNKNCQNIIKNEILLETEMNKQSSSISENHQMKEKIIKIEKEAQNFNEGIRENLAIIERKKMKRKKLKETLHLRTSSITTEIQNKEHKIKKISKTNQKLEEEHKQIVKKCMSLDNILKEMVVNSPSFHSIQSPKAKHSFSKLFPRDMEKD